MKKITSIKDRRIILSNLKSVLIENLGENIISVAVYGSSLNEDFCMMSDFDILVVLKEAGMNSLKLLRKIKEKFGLDGIEIDFIGNFRKTSLTGFIDFGPSLRFTPSFIMQVIPFFDPYNNAFSIEEVISFIDIPRRNIPAEFNVISI